MNDKRLPDPVGEFLEFLEREFQKANEWCEYYRGQRDACKEMQAQFEKLIEKAKDEIKNRVRENNLFDSLRTELDSAIRMAKQAENNAIKPESPEDN